MGRGHEVQGTGDHEAGESERPRDHGPRGEQGAQEGRHPAPLSGEGRGEEHHRHDAEVLEEQDADDELAVRSVELSPLGQALEDDRGAGERDQEADEDALRDRGPDEDGEDGDGRGGEPDLEAAAHREDAAEAPELVEGELEPDREEEQRHPDLGEALDLVDVAHRPEAARAEERPGHDEPGDGRQPEAGEQEHHRQRGREDDDEVAEEAQLVHGGLP
jgi:hypothetical protein